jgi:hypothetical protein
MRGIKGRKTSPGRHAREIEKRRRCLNKERGGSENKEGDLMERIRERANQ